MVDYWALQRRAFVVGPNGTIRRFTKNTHGGVLVTPRKSEEWVVVFDCDKVAHYRHLAGMWFGTWAGGAEWHARASTLHHCVQQSIARYSMHQQELKSKIQARLASLARPAQ